MRVKWPEYSCGWTVLHIVIVIVKSLNILTAQNKFMFRASAAWSASNQVNKTTPGTVLLHYFNYFYFISRWKYSVLNYNIHMVKICMQQLKHLPGLLCTSWHFTCTPLSTDARQRVRKTFPASLFLSQQETILSYLLTYIYICIYIYIYIYIYRYTMKLYNTYYMLHIAHRNDGSEL